MGNKRGVEAEVGGPKEATDSADFSDGIGISKGQPVRPEPPCRPQPAIFTTECHRDSPREPSSRGLYSRFFHRSVITDFINTDILQKIIVTTIAFIYRDYSAEKYRT